MRLHVILLFKNVSTDDPTWGRMTSNVTMSGDWRNGSWRKRESKDSPPRHFSLIFFQPAHEFLLEFPAFQAGDTAVWFVTHFKSSLYLVSTTSNSKVAAKWIRQAHSNVRPSSLCKWNADISKFKLQKFPYWTPGMARSSYGSSCPLIKVQNRTRTQKIRGNCLAKNADPNRMSFKAIISFDTKMPPHERTFLKEAVAKQASSFHISELPTDTHIHSAERMDVTVLHRHFLKF